MHVLITRPEGDGEILKERIEQLGSRATLEPLINIVFETIPLSSVTGATALIATSRNALRALASSPALVDTLALPLYTVGPGTTAVARELGFQRRPRGTGHRRRTRAAAQRRWADAKVAPSSISQAMYWPLISKGHWRERGLKSKR